MAKKREPNEAESAGAREKLIETASAIMRDNDVIDLSFSELSMRSGLNSALVKYYFGNKDGLMLALLERDMMQIVDGLTTLLAKPMKPAEKLTIHIGAVVDTFYDHPYLNRLLLRMVRDTSPDIANRIGSEYLRPIARAYEQLLEEGQKDGQFRGVDPQTFYFAVVGAADRFYAARYILRYCYDEPELTIATRDNYRENLVDMIMSGVLKN